MRSPFVEHPGSENEAYSELYETTDDVLFQHALMGPEEVPELSYADEELPGSYQSIPANRLDDLRYTDKNQWANTTEILAIRKKVYERHVANSKAAKKPYTYLLTVKDKQLREVDNSGEYLVPAAADWLEKLLLDARSALSQKNINIKILSGYRPAEEQFRSWVKSFPAYFYWAVNKAGIARTDINGIARYIGGRLAAPGFSNHNHGLAVDFRSIEGSKTFTIDTNPAHNHKAYWKKYSLFWDWLNKNASRYHYYPYPAEPWHWEFKPQNEQEVVNEVANPEDLFNDPYEGYENEYYNHESAEDDNEAQQSNLVNHELDDTQADGITAYLPVSVGGKLPAKTGVFIPADFNVRSGVDIVVFLHGHMGYTDSKTKQWVPNSSFAKKGIEYYWKNYANIRAYFSKSNRNAILLAPTLGSKSSVTFGNLNNENAFDEFVESCFSALKDKKLLSQHAVPNRIILAAHSGGGNPLGKILSTKNALLDNIDEVWGFDCLYGSWPDNYSSWAKTLPRNKSLTRSFHFYHYWAYTPGKTKSTPGVLGERLQQKFPALIKNVAPQKYKQHAEIIGWAWINEINNRTWFNPLGASSATPVHESVYEDNENVYDSETDVENLDYSEIPGLWNETESGEPSERDLTNEANENADFDNYSEPDEFVPEFENYSLSYRIQKVRDWAYLLTYKVPVDIVESLRARKMSVQYAHNESYSNDLNVDFYRLKINKFPVVSGVQMNASSLIKYIRLHFNEFIDTSISRFTPYEKSLDEAKWKSDNPRGAVMKIVMLDNAAVVTSLATPTGWRFSTITTPDTGRHPVSGQREFFIAKDPSTGSTYFVVKGLDMASTGLAGLGLPVAGEYGFKEGHKLWLSLRKNLIAFINANAGDAKEDLTYSERVEWRYVYRDFKNLLEQTFGKGAGSASNSPFFTFEEADEEPSAEGIDYENTFDEPEGEAESEPDFYNERTDEPIDNNTQSEEENVFAPEAEDSFFSYQLPKSAVTTFQLPLITFQPLVIGYLISSINENTATNNIFNVLHPELSGKKLGENDSESLKKEWSKIKSDLVIPTYKKFGDIMPPVTYSTEKIPVGFVQRNYNKWTGLDRKSTERVDEAARRLNKDGKLTRAGITDVDIETFQRIANAETGGKVQNFYSLDMAIISMGFRQFTFIHGYITKWINMAPVEFKKFGIEIDHDNPPYTIRRTVRGELKKYVVPRIKGVDDPESLRWNGWAQRFYFAGLNEKIMIAGFLLGKEYFATELNRLKSFVHKSPKLFDRFMGYYNQSSHLRAFFHELNNAAPAWVPGITVNALNKIQEGDSVSEFFKEFVNSAKQKFPEPEQVQRIFDHTG